MGTLNWLHLYLIYGILRAFLAVWAYCWICLETTGEGALFASYVVIDPGTTPLSQKQVLNEKEYREHRRNLVITLLQA